MHLLLSGIANVKYEIWYPRLVVLCRVLQVARVPLASLLLNGTCKALVLDQPAWSSISISISLSGAALPANVSSRLRLRWQALVTEGECSWAKEA